MTVFLTVQQCNMIACDDDIRPVVVRYVVGLARHSVAMVTRTCQELVKYCWLGCSTL